MLKCAACKKLVGKLGDMHECIDGEFRFCLAGGPVAPDAAVGVAGQPAVPVNLPYQYRATGWGVEGPVMIQNGDIVTIAGVKRLPVKQRGGRFTVNGWLALALVAIAALEAAAITVLLKEDRQLIQRYEHVLYIGGPGSACGALGTICYDQI